MVSPNRTESYSTDSTVRRLPRALPRSTGTLNAFRRPPKYSPSSATAASSSAAACVPGAGAGAPGGGGPYATRVTPAPVHATETWPTGVSRLAHASPVTNPIVPVGSDRTSRSALDCPRRSGLLRFFRLLDQPAERPADRQRG